MSRSGGWALGLAAVLATLVGGCASGGSPAAGTFTPHHHGVLTVATTVIPSPGFWEGSAERPTGGLEYELARDLAQRFGLGRVRIELIGFDQVVTGHLGDADLALDLLTPTGERDQFLTFSSPYLDAAPTVLVRTGTDVPDLETAQGLRWGAVRGTTLAGIIASSIQPDEAIRRYADTTALVAGLQSGQVDAVLLDLPLAVVTARRSGGKLDAVAQLPTNESIAAALPKGSGNLDAVSSAMRAFIADGTIHDLLSRWVGSDAANAESALPLLQTTL